MFRKPISAWQEAGICRSLVMCSLCRRSDVARGSLFGDDRNKVCPKGWTVEHLPSPDAIVLAKELISYKEANYPCSNCSDKVKRLTPEQQVKYDTQKIANKKRMCDSLQYCEKCCHSVKFRVSLINSIECPRGFTHTHYPKRK